jgi:CRISPR-associated protein (TIGR03986 family)
MSIFHNPYHFVPVLNGKRKGDLPVADWRKATANDVTLQEHLRLAGAVTHAKYIPGTYSGRLICRLTTETPTCVGAERTSQRGRVSEVDPFEIGGLPAIPASTLRGLISSVAEAASNSALRVLNRQTYSYRRAMDPKEVLSAIGMIRVTRTGKGEPLYWLMPLSIPMLEAECGGQAFLPREYRALFPEPLMKTYVGRYDEIRTDRFPYRTFDARSPKYYYLKLKQRAWTPGFGLEDDDCQNRKPYSRRFVVSQFTTDGQNPLAWSQVPASERSEYTCGIMRVLGCWGDRAQCNLIPKGKKHEIFLPLPTRKDWPVVPIPKIVVERFHALCLERTAASDRPGEVLLPLEPRDTRRNADPKGPGDRAFRLKEGDLVYFKAGLDANGRSYVSEISLSSIWRGMVVTLNGAPASAADFFAAVDPELLPFNSKREVITAAEQLFGFVEEREKTDAPQTKKEEQGRALASRVCFADALLEPKPGDAPALLPPVTLKILSSPKPPSPALYFKPSQGAPAYIAKRDLRPGNGAASHHPQGRKFYLHGQAAAAGQEPWKSESPREHADQKATVCPLRPHLDFFFHVDYSNLSAHELGLLLYALRPADAFRHKLGMGKSLGLGTVRIDVVALLEVDRQQRYSSAGLSASRHAQAWLRPSEQLPDLPQAVRAEIEAATQQASGGPLVALPLAFEDWLQTEAPAIHNALKLLGDPAKVRCPVHSPLIDGQDADKETFLWFVANDIGLKEDMREIPAQHKFLVPLTSNARELPVLERPPWQPKRQRL